MRLRSERPLRRASRALGAAGTVLAIVLVGCGAPVGTAPPSTRTPAAHESAAPSVAAGPSVAVLPSPSPEPPTSPELSPSPLSSPSPSARVTGTVPSATPRPSPWPMPSPTPRWDAPAATFAYRASAYAIRRMAPASRWYANRPLANLAVTAGRDADGVTIKMIEGRAYYHPVNMADQGLQLVDSFRKTADTAYLARARKVAARLRTEATLAGGALYDPYRFDVDWGSHSRKLAAPWYSAMAQGEVLSFLVAMHEITGEQRYLTWATQTFRSLARSYPARPWVTYADRSGNLWFEEYPLQPAEHVLNGNIFALFGLADYVGLTGDAEARRLLQGGLTTIERLGPRYRHAGSYS